MKEPIYLIILAIFFIWVGAVAHAEMIKADKVCHTSFSDGLHQKHVYIGTIMEDSNE